MLKPDNRNDRALAACLAAIALFLALNFLLSVGGHEPANSAGYQQTDGQTQSAGTDNKPEQGWAAIWRDPMSVFTGIIAALTLVLAVSTVFLWVETKRTAEAAAATIDLARQEYIASHRPRLVVRFVSEGRRASEGGDRPIYFVTVANIGDTEATITGVGADAGLRDKYNKRWIGPGLYTFAEGRPPPLPPEPILLAGEHRSYHLDPMSGTTATGHDDSDTLEACVAGEIVYTDKNGVTRRTGFLWAYDQATKRFVKSEESQYFYES